MKTQDIIQRDICSVYQLTEDAVSRYKRIKPSKFEAMKTATFAIKYKIPKSKILKLVKSKSQEDKDLLTKADAVYIETICEHFNIAEDDLKKLI
jgi:hypothetical protein